MRLARAAFGCLAVLAWAIRVDPADWPRREP